MDWPILRHLDILIGLAVVMLIVSTLVVAVTQLATSSLRRRSLYLRETVSELISQIAPKLTPVDARYVSERLLRHPLVGRKAWLPEAMGLGSASGSPLPLPLLARGEVVLRHEIIVALLEWAAVEGPIALQDRALIAKAPGVRQRLEALIEDLREALRECGIADPSQALRDLRTQVVAAEAENPREPAQQWYTQALTHSGLGDLTGRVFCWYDNSMQRVTEFFSIEAKAITSLVALAVCFAIQLDSIALLRELSEDDKFRSALATKAEFAKKVYEDVAKLPGVEDTDEKRKEAEVAIQESVEALRDPAAAVIREAWVWDEVAHLRVERFEGITGPSVLEVDARKVDIDVDRLCAERLPDCLAEAIKSSAAPVTVYTDAKGLWVVALSAQARLLRLTSGGREFGIPTRSWDSRGLAHRFPGVLLSWVLVSLGAPFWYDLLKKLLGLRSILQSRDDEDRAKRNDAVAGSPAIRPPAATARGAPSPLTVRPAGVLLDREASLRAAPEWRSAITRVLPAGYLVNVRGSVTGEAALSGADVNAKWRRTVQDDFLWDGDVRR
ncbi:MAG: hypothetical protein R2729_20765 [Bryobacteraceae bacterium]